MRVSITRTTALQDPHGIYDVLEQLCDQKISSGKYEPIVKTTPPMHVVVFSNSAPIRERLSQDRWDIVQIENVDAPVTPVSRRRRREAPANADPATPQRRRRRIIAESDSEA